MFSTIITQNEVKTIIGHSNSFTALIRSGTEEMNIVFLLIKFEFRDNSRLYTLYP